MPWILLVVGAVIGGFISEDLSGAVLGAFAGLAIGLASRVEGLARRLGDQAKETADLREKLAQLEVRLNPLPVPPPVSLPTPLAEAPAIPATPEKPAATLVWNLDEVRAQTGSASPSPHAAARAAEPPSSDQDSGWQRPSVPAEPHLFDRAITRAKNWLFGGNTVLRVGVVLLFLGLAFLLRYATEGLVVPVEARYAGVALCAVGLLGLGWWLRGRNAAYALTLQGAGIAVLYLTVFAAMKLHALLTPGLTLGLLIGVMLFSAILAVTQNSMALACVAALGGFAAPVLTSDGSGNHVALFGYLALLNAGILSIAWFKAWRPLNLIGFFGTFGIGSAWGLGSYHGALLTSTEPFLLLFFAMYLAIGLLFSRQRLLQLAQDGVDNRALPAYQRYVDGTLIFGTPIVAFGIQYRLVAHIPFAAAYSALALGLLYLGLARLLAGRDAQRLRLLVESCLALGVCFTTLAIPLGLDAHWTSVAWAVEGVAVYWLGLRQDRWLARSLGIGLQFVAGLMVTDSLNPWRLGVLTGDGFWTPLLIAVAGLVSAYATWRLPRLRFVPSQLAEHLLLLWAAVWWGMALVTLIQPIDPDLHAALMLLALAGSTLLWMTLSLRLGWASIGNLILLLGPACVLVLLDLGDTATPLQHWGWLGWLAVLVTHLLSLRWLDPQLPRGPANAAHTLGCWLVVAVLTLQLHHGVLDLSDTRGSWRWLAWVLVPALFLMAMASQRRWPWPVSGHETAYRLWAPAPIAVLLLLWAWVWNLLDRGNAAPLPYLPLLNPLELALCIATASVYLWARHCLPLWGVDQARVRQWVLQIGGVTLFALITCAVLRAAHHWAGVPWDDDALFDSMLVQAALSITWTLVALALMIGGHLRRRRDLWLVGAGLIALVVVKLFFVELSNRGSLERIVSFIGVGILLLVVGYFSPLPPKRAEPPTDPEAAPVHPAKP